MRQSYGLMHEGGVSRCGFFTDQDLPLYGGTLIFLACHRWQGKEPSALLTLLMEKTFILPVQLLKVNILPHFK